MPSLPQRIRNAGNALLGRSPGLDDFASSSVRSWEENPWALRSKQTDAAALVSRWCGTVKTAGSRNSMGVASLKLRVYRRTRGGAKYWDARAITKDMRAYLRAGSSRGGAGFYATKAADRLEEFEEIVDPLFPLNRLLIEANPVHNGYEMVEGVQNWLGLAGNAYWMVAREGSGPVAPDETVEVWPLAPQFTRPVPSRESVVGGYIYGRGTEIEATYAPSQVVHFRNPNPAGSPYLGMGDLETCVREADLSSSFVDFAQAMLMNGAQPGVIISGRFTPDQKAAAETSLKRKHEGVKNAGRSMLINGEEVKIQTLNLSEKEVAFLQSGERMETVIAGCHDMPVAILRLETAALATAKESIRHWQIMGVAPRARRIEDTLNQRLIRGVLGYGDDVFVAFDPAVTRDLEADSVRVKALYDSQIITKNEAREECGYEHVEGGDDFKADPDPLGFGFGGGSNDGSRDRKPGDRGGDDHDEGAGGGTGGKSRRHVHPRVARAVPRLTTAAISAAAMLLTGGHECHAKCGQRYGRTVGKDARARLGVIEVSERELEAALRRWFLGSLHPAVVANIAGDGLAVELSGDKELRTAFLGETREQLGKLFLDGYNHGVADVQALAAMNFLPALSDPVRARMVGFQSRAFASTTDTVTRAIRASLAEGIGAGESVRELTNRAAEFMGEVAKYAPERIARTESARAYLTSREDAWVESDVVEGKEWLLSADPCEFCEAMAREYQTAEIGKPFIALGGRLTGTEGGSMDIDYAALDTPPLHPNCRCSLAAIFKE